MQHSIKDLWLYPFPEIDVVHTQEPLLPEPELTTPGRCICCRQNVRHRFRLDDSWPLRQLTDTISDTRVRLNKATEHLDKLKKRGEPVATGEKEKYNTAVKAAERALEQARLSARRLSLRHVQKAEITSTESLSEKEQELFHEDGPPYSLCAFCHAWHSLNGYAAAQGVMVWLHEVGREIRRQTERHSTPRNWQPHLPEDAQPAGYRWTDDESVLHAPSLHLQLFNTQVTTQGNLVQAGGLWHGMVSITLPPQNLQTFNELVRAVPRAVPWRIRMDLMPGGMKALNLKKTLLTYSSFISAVRPMYESVMALAATDEKEPVCIMTIMASTWGKTREICTRNQAILKSAIEGWGVCGTTTTFGDPRRAWVNTILAASGGSGPVPLYPPLSHAISLFPLNRAGSVWRGKGNLMLHTEDGSAIEVGLASSQQNKHTELAPGDPGLGKSVLINTLSEIQISSAQKNLPFIAYIDKGYSAQGLVQLIRDSLPPERKDEAVGIILSNDPEYTRNLFDVMYGAKKPITPEKNFMSSVLCALCVDTGTGQPCNPGDTRQIINQLIELAFKEYGENNPRLYRASTEELVDSALQDSGLYEKHDATWWARSTWFEVRDMLHNAGYIMAAQRAHYQAMPQLPEVSSMLGHTSLRDVFGTVQRDGSNELLLDYIRRALEQGHNDYPMIEEVEQPTVIYT